MTILILLISASVSALVSASVSGAVSGARFFAILALSASTCAATPILFLASPILVASPDATIPIRFSRPLLDSSAAAAADDKDALSVYSFIALVNSLPLNPLFINLAI